ncbi:MAG: hypothetical protein C0484_04015 [Rhodospirillum sp.]|jgi:dTDP-4-dehydrorhamnose 3,5-epimerase|nr:hypothetical protein [Rhodospirillum sp.]
MTPDHPIALPAGAKLIPLTAHADRRGNLTEVFRSEWFESASPVQWVVTRTEANALRGVHAHARQWDYYCLVAGELVVGLHDLRPGSSSVRTAMLRMSGERLQLLAVPMGVAHGLYSPTHSTLMVGTSAYYDPADHRGCRWDDPELGLEWPCTSPILSAKDRDAGSCAELKAGLLADLAMPSASV